MIVANWSIATESPISSEYKFVETTVKSLLPEFVVTGNKGSSHNITSRKPDFRIRPINVAVAARRAARVGVPVNARAPTSDKTGPIQLVEG